MLKLMMISACAGLIMTLTATVAQEVKGGATINAPVAAPTVAKKMKGAIGSAANPIRATTVAPLTIDECTTLGGKAVSESVCNSGKACETTTQNGEWKRVCLSKAE